MTWIKCSDQPPPDGWHLAYSPVHGVMLSRQRVLVIDTFGRQMECTESGIEITHWMPMPEPPGAEKPRKVKLPMRYTLMEWHDTDSGYPEMDTHSHGQWLNYEDILDALKAAGVEIE